jgi:hypothetical protein
MINAAIVGLAPYPVPTVQMIETVAALEAVIHSMKSNAPVVVNRQ